MGDFTAGNFIAVFITRSRFLSFWPVDLSSYLIVGLPDKFKRRKALKIRKEAPLSGANHGST
jgi:hypothetical protein